MLLHCLKAEAYFIHIYVGFYVLVLSPLCLKMRPYHIFNKASTVEYTLLQWKSEYLVYAVGIPIFIWTYIFILMITFNPIDATADGECML